MNLIERSEQLQANVDKLIHRKEFAKKVTTIRSRSTQFKNEVNKLSSNYSQARLLQERGVSVNFVINTERVQSFLRELQSKFDDADFANELGDADIKNEVLIPIRNFSEKIKEETEKAWDDYFNGVLPKINNELLKMFSSVPGLKSKVENINSIYYEILEFGSSVPNNDEFDRFENFVIQFKQEYKALEDESKHMNPEVLTFFRDAATAKGADLSSLTHTVLEWLNYHGQTDSLGIRVR